MKRSKKALTAPEYLGVPFGTKIDSLMVEVRGRDGSEEPMPCSKEAAVIYGYKWATLIAASSGGPGETPSFVNLTELSRIDIEFMIGVIAVRLIVKHKGDKNVARRQITLPSCCGGIMSLTRSIVKSDRIGSLSTICDFAPPENLQDVAGVVRMCIFTMMNSDHALEKYTYLPNNVRQRAIDNQDSVLSATIGDDAHAKIVRQDSDVFQEVRGLSMDRSVEPDPQVYDIFDPAKTSGLAIKTRSALEATCCAIVGCETTHVTDISSFADKLTTPTNTNIYTVQDPCGEIFCYLKHFFPETGGFPIQGRTPNDITKDEDAHLAVAAVAKDSCNLSFDKDAIFRMGVTHTPICPNPVAVLQVIWLSVLVPCLKNI